MLSKFGRQLVAAPLSRVVPLLRAMGFTPNGLTYLGFILTVVTAVVLAGGYFRIGAIFLMIAAVFDMLDGYLARATDQTSTFGAFLDSTLDRYSEGVILLALTFFYSTQIDGRTEMVLIFLTLVGSLMVSYTRARAEALNIECKVGILQRPERIVLLIVGLLTGWMLPILWVLAVLTNFTAFQRIYEVYWRTHSKPVGPGDKVVNTKDNWPVQG